MQLKNPMKLLIGIFSLEMYIALLFMVSGFAALIYQIVWQRVLFTTFGINSEAVTVIVSVFMLGLGVGALVGGYIQKVAPKYLLQIFLMLEVSIGIFGIFSLELIRHIGMLSNTSTTSALVFWTYAILAFPTLCMGATLPILVGYVQKHFNNLGKSIGLLYAANTIGSAIAAFFTVQFIFVYAGQTASVHFAAICNLVVAMLIFDVSRRVKIFNPNFISSEKNDYTEREANVYTSQKAEKLPYWATFVGLFFVGYISLSQEIIWYRLLGFLTGGKPQVFGFLLTAFLVGIAAGSVKSKTICERGRDPVLYLLKALFISTLVFYLSIPVVASVAASFGKEAGTLIAYILIAAVAFYTGGILPMLIHIGVDQRQSDGGVTTQRMSLLYFSNILGATLGPLVTGFLFLDIFSLEGNILVLTCIALFLLLAALRMLPQYGDFNKVLLILVSASVVVWQFVHQPLYNGHLESLQYGSPGHKAFKHVVENRASIITVAEARGSDIIYGGGVYDGRFNIDPVVNSNWVDRAFMVAALHRKPEKILEIGLSSGSWTKVLTDYQPLEKLTVVEINKGYLDVIANYPQIHTALKNPKVELIFDDGRRWLRNHPHEKFDFIVMNTTFYWRNNSTNLLSREFLNLCKSRLNQGGVVYFNTTDLRDIVFTAASVFKHVTMYRNFVAASDQPFTMSEAEIRNNLLQFKDEHEISIFDKDQKHQDVLMQLSKYIFNDIGDSVLREPKLNLITDDNMFPEYKTTNRVGN